MDNDQARYKIALAAAEQLTGSRQRAEIWLRGYVRALDAKPVDLLESDGGLEAVLTVIGRLEHGIIT
ncbi:MAG: MbcA/ParS/Xre antitoxin family protein [Pseudomonas sp.]|nr:MbcA/ParS/Xre antitoxin family protein [Pseudomonas sp.]